MIPKVIHYCWFNNTPIPHSLRVCMNSWKKKLPDYSWRKWDLNSFDVNSLDWTKEALSENALAFVADYVRLYALYNEGGIYMDTDVLVKKSFDPLLKDRFFTAAEWHPEMIEADELADQRLEEDGTNKFPGVRVPGVGLLSAILASEKGHPFVREAMKFYETHHFLNADGTWYTKEIAPDVLALAAEKFGLKYKKDITQHLSEGICIYPSSILGAAYTQNSPDSFALHLSKGSWRKRTLLRSILTKFNFYRKIFKAGQE